MSYFDTDFNYDAFNIDNPYKFSANLPGLGSSTFGYDDDDDDDDDGDSFDASKSISSLSKVFDALDKARTYKSQSSGSINPAQFGGTSAEEIGKNLTLVTRGPKKITKTEGSGGGLFGSIGGLAGTLGTAAGIFGPLGAPIGALVGKGIDTFVG